MPDQRGVLFQKRLRHALGIEDSPSCTAEYVPLCAGRAGRRVNVRCGAFCVARSPSCVESARPASRPPTRSRKRARSLSLLTPNAHGPRSRISAKGSQPELPRSADGPFPVGCGLPRRRDHVRCYGSAQPWRRDESASRRIAECVAFVRAPGRSRGRGKVSRRSTATRVSRSCSGLQERRARDEALGCAVPVDGEL
jgi:hypothetical protein